MILSDDAKYYHLFSHPIVPTLQNLKFNVPFLKQNIKYPSHEKYKPYFPWLFCISLKYKLKAAALAFAKFLVPNNNCFWSWRLTVWKNKRFTLTWKMFHQNSTLCDIVPKALISQIYVEGKFPNFTHCQATVCNSWEIVVVRKAQKPLLSQKFHLLGLNEDIVL